MNNSSERKKKRLKTQMIGALLGLGVSFSTVAEATTIELLIQKYSEQAKKQDPKFAGFSAEQGKKFYFSEHKDNKGQKASCSGCHTPDPKKSGKTTAGKDIEPMAPSVNKKRYTDEKHVEKWFKRNCKDVLSRECTLQEKGDFLSFMKNE